MSKWYVKRSYPNESTMMLFGDLKEAQKFCDDLNERYQSTGYYVEEFDQQKHDDGWGKMDDILNKLREENK